MQHFLYFVWEIDPVFLDLGSLQIRYYGILFAGGIFIGYLFWRTRMMRLGYSEDVTESFVVWGFLAVLIGARLGHCLFYEPEIYLKQPWRILRIWEGGLASHGAAIMLVITLYLYHRIQKVPLLDVLDCFSLPTACGATAVRIGNFMNSEIVGRTSDVPWAMKFPLYEAYMKNVPLDQIDVDKIPARHPSQLYEVFLGLVVFFSLYAVDRKYGKNRPKGILAAMTLAIYFTGRFLVEYVKEFQGEVELQKYNLTMGQMLSLPFALTGYGMLIWILFLRKKSQPEENQSETTGQENKQNQNQNRSQNQNPGQNQNQNQNQKKKNRKKKKK